MNFTHAYNRKLLQREFERWLEEPVALSNCDIMTRQDSIYEFIYDLKDFVNSKGYSFRVDVKDLARAWARYRFKLYFGLYEGKKLYYNPCPESHEEDLNMFHDTFDGVLWNQYLENISTWPDFGYDRPDNRKAMFSILTFVWYYIDIQGSNKTAMVDDMFASSDDDNEGYSENDAVRTNHVDPYIRDQADHI